MNLERSFDQLSITEEAPPRRPDLIRLNAQRGMTCHDPPPNHRRCSTPDDDEKTLETVFSQAQRRFPMPRRLPSARSQDEEMSLASMGAQELEFYWQPSGSTRSLSTTGSHRRRLQRNPTPPHLVRTLTMSSHRPHNPVAWSLRQQNHTSSSRGLWRQSSLLTNDSGGSGHSRPPPPTFYSSRHSSTRTFASQDTL